MFGHQRTFRHFAEELADIRQRISCLDSGLEDARRGAADTKQADWKLSVSFGGEVSRELLVSLCFVGMQSLRSTCC